MEREKKAYIADSVETNLNIGESDDQVRDKSESKYQRVKDKSETIEKMIEKRPDS